MQKQQHDFFWFSDVFCVEAQLLRDEVADSRRGSYEYDRAVLKCIAFWGILSKLCEIGSSAIL